MLHLGDARVPVELRELRVVVQLLATRLVRGRVRVRARARVVVQLLATRLVRVKGEGGG